MSMMSMPNAGHQAAPRSMAAAPLSAIAERLQSGQQASTSGSSFIRPHLRDMDPYTPILPFEVLSQQLGRRPEDIVKLDANENPYGPPPEVLQALGSMQFPNIYPDPQSRRLREALSQLTGVPIEHLLVRQLTLHSVALCHWQTCKALHSSHEPCLTLGSMLIAASAVTLQCQAASYPAHEPAQFACLSQRSSGQFCC